MISELSIIIPTLNEEKYLPKLLASIEEQEFGGRLQVIVVDGFSKDNTVREAQKFQRNISDLVILSEKRGTSYQRNRGADKAKYEHLLFLDADILLPRNFLQRLSKRVNEKEQFIDFVLHIPVRFNVFDYLFIFALFGYSFIMQFFDPALSGSFILTTKTIHKKINGFAEKAIIGEDVDYCDRATLAGAKYHLHYFPYVLASPRRLRAEGRMKLIFLWAKAYLHVKKHGPITDPKLFRYEFGQFKGD